MAAKRDKAAKPPAPASAAPRRPAGSRVVEHHAELIAEVDAAGENVVLSIGSEAVKLTNLEKVLWPAHRSSPAFTRRDYVRYLLHAGPYMLPHMQDRPLTLIRMPDGVKGRRFVHFHWEQKLPRFDVRVKTLAAPYSLRTVPGAPVSMPLTWAELRKAGPHDFSMDNVPALLARRGDIWQTMLDRKQKLESVLATSAEGYESRSPRSPRVPPRRKSG